MKLTHLCVSYRCSGRITEISVVYQHIHNISAENRVFEFINFKKFISLSDEFHLLQIFINFFDGINVIDEKQENHHSNYSVEINISKYSPIHIKYIINQ